MLDLVIENAQARIGPYCRGTPMALAIDDVALWATP